MSSDELMTIEEVARYLKMKPQTVYKWAQEGQLPGVKLGKEWRFRKAHLDEWVDTSVLLSRGGFDLMFRSSVVAARKTISPEEVGKLVREAMS